MTFAAGTYELTLRVRIVSSNSDLTHGGAYLKAITSPDNSLGAYYIGEYREIAVGTYDELTVHATGVVTVTAATSMGLVVSYKGTGVSIPANTTPYGAANLTVIARKV